MRNFHSRTMWKVGKIRKATRVIDYSLGRTTFLILCACDSIILDGFGFDGVQSIPGNFPKQYWSTKNHGWAVFGMVRSCPAPKRFRAGKSNKIRKKVICLACVTLHAARPRRSEPVVADENHKTSKSELLYVPRPISAPCPTCATPYMCHALEWLKIIDHRIRKIFKFEKVEVEKFLCRKISKSAKVKSAIMIIIQD